MLPSSSSVSEPRWYARQNSRRARSTLASIVACVPRCHAGNRLLTAAPGNASPNPLLDAFCWMLSPCLEGRRRRTARNTASHTIALQHLSVS